MKKDMEKLLKRLPKKYHEAVRNFEADIGLVDDCKYMLYFNDDYPMFDGGYSVPCKSIAEAIEFIKGVF